MKQQEQSTPTAARTLDRSAIWSQHYQTDDINRGGINVTAWSTISCDGNTAVPIAKIGIRVNREHGSADANTEMTAGEMRRLARALERHADRLETLAAEAARLTQEAHS